MLEYLRLSREHRPSERKFRLFVCACCRQLWPFLTDPRSRRAVEVAERYADGLTDEAFARAAAAEAGNFNGPYRSRWPGWMEWRVRLYAALAAAGSAECPLRLRDLLHEAAAGVALFREGGPIDAAPGETPLGAEKAPCDLLREIIGNPFRPASLERSCLTPAVLALAHAAYEERALPAGTLDPARLAVLGDALEEAGCADAELLAHCRGPGPHVRGCWAVDAVRSVD
jgi:hypothetical protein